MSLESCSSSALLRDPCNSLTELFPGLNGNIKDHFADEKEDDVLAMAFVMLTAHFEATRGIFWGGPRNFEPLSHGDDDT
ncbi:hypothetical protein AVEN_4298-1 [Araneus ventricosus]|uniref:Uncharacterized protein n=1 Tax=Araneus ventricosus TaxID=182803 RepID=A0A4Y2WRJ8_ARAVE|nr:hypothetical protein AVEN_4298-1 [Araneus ventricosus]